MLNGSVGAGMFETNLGGVGWFAKLKPTMVSAPTRARVVPGPMRNRRGVLGDGFMVFLVNERAGLGRAQRQAQSQTAQFTKREAHEGHDRPRRADHDHAKCRKRVRFALREFAHSP